MGNACGGHSPAGSFFLVDRSSCLAHHFRLFFWGRRRDPSMSIVGCVALVLFAASHVSWSTFIPAQTQLFFTDADLLRNLGLLARGDMPVVSWAERCDVGLPQLSVPAMRPCAGLRLSFGLAGLVLPRWGSVGGSMARGIQRARAWRAAKQHIPTRCSFLVLSESCGLVVPVVPLPSVLCLLQTRAYQDILREGTRQEAEAGCGSNASGTWVLIQPT